MGFGAGVIQLGFISTKPPKKTCPLKWDYISIGNTSSNHSLSEDMLVFRGVTSVWEKRVKVVSSKDAARCFWPIKHSPLGVECLWENVVTCLGKLRDYSWTKPVEHTHWLKLHQLQKLWQTSMATLVSSSTLRWTLWKYHGDSFEQQVLPNRP